MGTPFEHLKALVVDDNPHMRAILRTLLGDMGVHEIFEAAEEGAPWRCCSASSPTSSSPDLSMAPVDGIAFTHELRNSRESPNPFLPVIMVSGQHERTRNRRGARRRRDRVRRQADHRAKPSLKDYGNRRAAPAFVRTPSYFGPDRRRQNDAFHVGPWRRQEDRARNVAPV